MALKSYLAALERTQVVLWITMTAVVLNAGINYALIFGNWGAPEMGVRGAAIASVLTQVVTFVALGFYAHWQPDLRRFNLFQRFWRPDWQAMHQVYRVGWPIGLTGLAEGGLFQASAIMMGWIGTVQLAAHGIALEVTALAFMVHLGLSNAATVRVGRAMGQGNAQSLRDGAKVALVLSLGFGVAMVVLFLALPGPIVALFLDRTNPSAGAIIAFGTVLLALSALFQMVDATQAMALGFLRGMQDTRAPMWIVTLSYWGLGIPSSYVLAFPLGFGGAGLWLGLTVGLSVAAGLLMWRFWSRAPKA
jgi:MATE family multidrug resistance protein